jgi:hypothetical protein
VSIVICWWKRREGDKIEGIIYWWERRRRNALLGVAPKAR